MPSGGKRPGAGRKPFDPRLTALRELLHALQQAKVAADVAALPGSVMAGDEGHAVAAEVIAALIPRVSRQLKASLLTAEVAAERSAPRTEPVQPGLQLDDDA